MALAIIVLASSAPSPHRHRPQCTQCRRLHSMWSLTARCGERGPSRGSRDPAACVGQGCSLTPLLWRSGARVAAPRPMACGGGSPRKQRLSRATMPLPSIRRRTQLIWPRERPRERPRILNSKQSGKNRKISRYRSVRLELQAARCKRRAKPCPRGNGEALRQRCSDE